MEQHMPVTYDQLATMLEENQPSDNSNKRKSCLFPHSPLAPERTTFLSPLLKS